MNKPITLTFESIEVSTILAALAAWEAQGAASSDALIDAIASQNCLSQKLSPQQVADLHVRIVDQAFMRESEESSLYVVK
jgi:hypothetical protein